MKKFAFNGRNYQIENGLVHSVDNSQDFTTLDPVYRGDNVILDGHCDALGFKLYDRPSGIRAYGNQLGSRSK
ncbi:hypothetical protein LCGC14_0277990 [marine sediment metagenome]|uniref:Uncharacterized protein n=1 Tax=marine sediment metagenome TaxID=412755 RepID=A0A0F9TWS5_9ZZZZ